MKKQSILRCAIVMFVSVLCGSMFCGCCGKNDCAVPTTDSAAVTVNSILQRKSVRSYTGDAIPDSIVQSLLRCAVAAPSGMDIRPWHIVLMTDKSVYDTLFAGNFNMEKFKQSGAVFIFCADTTVTRPPRENPDAPAVTTPNPIWRDDMGACVENFLVAVEAYGLGACWTACYPFPNTMKPVVEYLQLPSNILPYAIVPVGYPAGDNQPKDKWNESRIHYGRW